MDAPAPRRTDQDNGPGRGGGRGRMPPAAAAVAVAGVAGPPRGSSGVAAEFEQQFGEHVESLRRRTNSPAIEGPRRPAKTCGSEQRVGRLLDADQPGAS